MKTGSIATDEFLEFLENGLYMHPHIIETGNDRVLPSYDIPAFSWLLAQGNYVTCYTIKVNYLP